MSQGKKEASPSQVTRRLPNRPSWDYDDLSITLRSYDRQPFFNVLSMWLECGPDPEDVYAMAKAKPDLWVKALADLSRIAGFTEKQEILHTVNVNQMSDSQLEDAAAKMAAQLGIPFAPRLIAKPTLIPSENDEAKAFHGKTIEAEANPPAAKQRKSKR